MDDLRRKRAKRLGARGKGHIGSMRILSIYNRGTRKFPGDLSLWREYLDYAKKQHAYKTVVEILTKMVRLHPSKAHIWIFAANSAFTENGDMTEARSYMQRGLRFCKDSQELWLSYGRLELMYLSKLIRRQRILGLDNREEAKHPIDEGLDADIITLPPLTIEDLNPVQTQDRKTGSSQDNPKTPATQGAIPMAIFDAAMQQFESVELAGQFFDLTFELLRFPVARPIASHMLLKMRALAADSARTLDCYIREPLVGVEPSSTGFPRCIRESLGRLKSTTNESPSLELAARTVTWVTAYLRHDLDTDLRMALTKIAVGAINHYQSIHGDHCSGSGDELAALLQKFDEAKIREPIQPVLSWASQMWPSNQSFRELKWEIGSDGA